jgi:hypothetical protein
MRKPLTATDPSPAHVTCLTVTAGDVAAGAVAAEAVATGAAAGETVTPELISATHDGEQV